MTHPFKKASVLISELGLDTSTYLPCVDDMLIIIKDTDTLIEINEIDGGTHLDVRLVKSPEVSGLLLESFAFEIVNTVNSVVEKGSFKEDLNSLIADLNK